MLTADIDSAEITLRRKILPREGQIYNWVLIGNLLTGLTTEAQQKLVEVNIDTSVVQARRVPNMPIAVSMMHR